MADEDDDSTTQPDLGDLGVARIEAEEPQRRRLARLAQPRSFEESVAVLLQSDLRRRDLPRSDIPPEILKSLGTLVEIIAHTVWRGDADKAKELAELLPVAQKIVGKHDRVAAIYGIIKSWVESLPFALGQFDYAATKMPLPTRMGLAMCGMPISDEVEGTMVPLIVTNIQAIGFGQWGAREVCIQLMRASGYSSESEQTLGILIDNSLKKTKKVTAKKG